MISQLISIVQLFPGVSRPAGVLPLDLAYVSAYAKEPSERLGAELKAEQKPTQSTGLVDRLGRTVDYLRIAVTDRCNLRCSYCHPGPESTGANGSLLSVPELGRVVRIAVSLGIRNIRLTGGEPATRPDLVRLIAEISQICGGKLTMTSNGTLLAPLAPELQRAGLSRINISIDSLDESRYARITGESFLSSVLDGLEASLAAGIKTKVNVVAIEDLELDEITAFYRLADEKEIEVRFIELMPLCSDGWQPGKYLPLDAVEARLAKECKWLGRIGVASVYQYGNGRVGFIRSVTDPFCSDCNRLRLAADGTLRPCLFSNQGLSLYPLLRGGAADNDIARLFAKAVEAKPRGHALHDLGSAHLENHPCARLIGG
jgi:cyclic pyranopterin phosphate synthase